jgi:glutamyl-tRNA synthetase
MQTALSQSELKELADILYPDVTQSPDDFERIYPPRILPSAAMVTRFAPSPTGFIHIGGIYASLISKLLADQSGGLFFLRIEDTDQRREVLGGSEEIITALQKFSVEPTEGYVEIGIQVGGYGPYIQSQRKEIYAAYAKWMIEKDLAYPCFCSEEDLEQIANDQEKAGAMQKGYYGKWARHRNLTLNEIKEQLKQSKQFVLRVKAPEESHLVHVIDLIRGKMEMESNTHDMVLIKSNGLPTYHFAHVIDDHLMRTTHVTRGFEWISSLPLHIQLFQMLEMEVPTYIHFSHIGKKEGESVRKLSKRKDAEAAVSSYLEKGYPHIAVLEYLLNLANSNFSDWRKNNPDKHYQEFPIDPRRIGKTIAIFDQKKLEDISRDVISKMTAEAVYQAVKTWAIDFDPEFYKLLDKYPEYSLQILGIERNQVNPRKDIITWSEVTSLISYFYDERFETDTMMFLPTEISKDDILAVLQFFIDNYDQVDEKDAWYEKCQLIAESLNFARDLKTYKVASNTFKGHIGHLMLVLRLALTHQSNTPDLYQLMSVMGKARVIMRLRKAREAWIQ